MIALYLKWIRVEKPLSSRARAKALKQELTLKLGEKLPKT
jgi:hypothetical protein